ncbi:PiT family inorganic phosphate transporter [Mucilaginibacter yixingensis]|uniref:PiT family inorganic phosphate transporter n=1 Tax=Mucilaginibacter yixingensis TaxID=1295612 RepID=A0A2T5J7W0_9SPHI|nr:inorganic phosphate transporter [Mucilaginibacter yixingensis]PTQ95555.1 PiT family inorganic phosphate transporter [Mucilaginibacter yixingensis]
MVTTLLVVVIILAVVFDFINGFHDAANSIATVVSTKVLTPFQAVIWAAAFNFLAFFIIKEHNVAGTVAKTVHEQFITMHVILAGLLAAITWNLITWWFGIPSSSSHTLIGGFAGAGMTNAMFMHSSAIAAINVKPILTIIAYIFLAPFIGLIIAYIITIIILHVCKNARPAMAERWFKALQLVSSAALSYTHGGNDAQKVMGIIYVSLVASKLIPMHAGAENMPEWIPLTCYTAIALGTMSGGWKIVKTMGTKITKVTPLEGVSAETAGAITLFITERLGIPVSTTHTITGSIIGVGLTKRVSAVRWGVTLNLVWAWIITIPISALIAAIVFSIIHFIG